MKHLKLSKRLAGEYLYIDKTLGKILLTAMDHWPDEDMIITSIWRSANENMAAGAKTNIHVTGPPYRALDLRIINIAEDYQEAADIIAKNIKTEWIYDPSRPNLNVVYAKLHGTGPHIHLQVHHNTVRR